MNWFAFAALAWLLMGMESGLRDALALGPSRVAPSFVVALLALVAMAAPATTTLAAGLVIGVLLDLTSASVRPGLPETVTIVGPHALGAMAGAYTALVTRGIVIKHNPLTFAFMAFLISAIMHIVAVSLLEVRSWWDPLPVEATREALERLGSAVYTAVVALPLGWLLRKVSPLLSFPQSGPVRRMRY